MTFSFDMFGNSGFGGNMDFGYNPNSQPNLMGADADAVMYVFGPSMNMIGDVAHRPYNYSFGDNFTAKAKEMADISARGSMSAYKVVDHLMGTMNFSEHLMPTAQPSANIKTSVLSDNWRFFLILTASSSELRIGNTIAMTDNSPKKIRWIYTGFFMDEPFNPLSFSETKRSLNPNATMVITHKTIVDLTETHNGFSKQVFQNTASSEEIMRRDVTMNLTSGTRGGEGLFVMTPENCIKSINATGDEGDFFMSPSNQFGVNDSHFQVSDRFENTGKNVAQVMQGFVNYIDETSAAKLSSPTHMRMFDGFEDMNLDFQMTKLANAMVIPQTNKINQFDLNVNSTISPVTLDNMVNHRLKVESFKTNAPLYRDMADQTIVSFVNQYSNLIAFVTVPIMNQTGLNRIIFEYGVKNVMGSPADDFQVYQAGMFYPVPGMEEEATRRALALLTELKKGIFRVIFESQGDFHVTVNAETTGMVLIRLSLIGAGHASQCDFEIPAFLGGVISPLIGDSVSIQNNSAELFGLFNEVTGNNNNIDQFIPQQHMDYFNDVGNLDFQDLGEDTW